MMDITFEALMNVVSELDVVSTTEAWILFGIAFLMIGLGMLIRKRFERRVDREMKKELYEDISEVYE